MKVGICRVAIAPMRLEPKDSSEMVSQLLWGEKVEILEKTKKWCLIKNDFDAYTGWVDAKQIIEIPTDLFFKLTATHYTSDFINLMQAGHLPMGLSLATPIYLQENNREDMPLLLGDTKYTYLGESIANQNDVSIITLAQKYMNVPYLWGGRSSFGIDCSGLVQQVFKLKGIPLPRDAKDQAEKGEMLGFIFEAQPGDVAFFDNEEGKIIHTGILQSPNEILHAHGHVRIDAIDSNGIFNKEAQTYSHKLRFIKRMII